MLISGSCFDEHFKKHTDKCDYHEQRRNAERTCEIVLVIENFNMQRNRVGGAANVA